MEIVPAEVIIIVWFGLEEEVGEGFEDWQEKSAIVVTFHRKV
jgi:hypothetical protein